MIDHGEDKRKLRTGCKPSAKKPVNSHIITPSAKKFGHKTKLKRLQQH